MKDAPFYKIENDEEDTKYFLKGITGPDTAITADQYTALEEFGAAVDTGTSGDLSEANIAKLHAEQDPANPLYQGSQPANAGVSGTAAENPAPATAYYEPTADKIDPIADAAPEQQGTTTITTEEATRPYEAPVEEVPVTDPAPEGLPVVETPAPQTPTQDESIAGA